MPFSGRPRRLARAALTGALTVAFLAACANEPNSIFHAHTEFNREVGGLFHLLIWLGTAVFVFVEALLVYALIRFRKREGQETPEQVHGNTTLEIMWTVIPALILVVIAVPTVRTIFRTQAAARADALTVEVYGHQWWWEFRYPEYNVVTANEVYVPIGRTVNFVLRSKDVIHSFWVPQMGGKRDVMPGKHANFLWFTPDSVQSGAFNGFCVEYCGASHANMRFRMYTVTPAQFAAWAAHEASPAAMTPVMPGATPAATATATAPASGAAPAVSATTATPVTQAAFIAFPHEQMGAHTVPQTPLPPTLAFNDGLQGDAGRGQDLLTKGMGGCLGCHRINGNPMMVGQIGPDLTHVGSRNTIAAGLYPNDARHLARWIKNARLMKPGVIMPTLGQGELDPIMKSRVASGLTDQQIADIVAYLQALK